ncbi:MAG: response regulator [Pseudomonadota bacterium]
MSATPTVYIVDDDDAVRDAMGLLLETADVPHHGFNSAESFLEAWNGSQRGCLVLDVRMPGMDGARLQKALNDAECHLPIIFLTGHGDVPMAVEAMRHGALDFLRKPVAEQDLLELINNAFALESTQFVAGETARRLQGKLDSLTDREHEVFTHVAQGMSNKVIAAELDISERTVEVHRSQVMKKLDAASLADLVRIHVESESA